MFVFHSNFGHVLVITTIFSCVMSSQNYDRREVSYTFQKPKISSVLFDESCLSPKRCWTRRQIANLHSRLVLQDLLPPRMPKNVALIYPYIRLCLETAKLQIDDELVRIAILKVMSDMFGGYQQAYGLPLLKEISYEGNIDYRTVESCLRMQDEFKNVLNTNGLKWPSPLAIKTAVTRVKELNLTILDAGELKPCENIYLRDPRGREFALNGEPRPSNQSSHERSLPISMPLFDDNIHPNAVAIPFRDRKFCSLTSENGRGVLVDYYIGSIRCLKWLSQDWFDNSLVADFDKTFRNWIVNNVLPHLQSGNQWYPAFSGVYRILMTIQSKEFYNNNNVEVASFRQQDSTLPKQHSVAVKAQRKLLIWQNDSTKKADHPKIWDRLISRANVVTYFSTALLMMFFIFPILIVGYKNFINFKDFCSKFYNQNTNEPFLEIREADLHDKNVMSDISPNAIGMKNSNELNYCELLTEFHETEESPEIFPSIDSSLSEDEQNSVESKRWNDSK